MAQKGQRKVLIALDGSPSATAALDWYFENLQKDNDYVYCMTVPEYSLSGITVGPFANTDALMSQFNEQHAVVQKMCSDITANLRSKNVKGQMDAVGAGEKPGPAILQQAISLNVDCIIMGTRGLSKVKSLLMGSVSQFVLQNWSKPITIVPQPSQ